MNKTKSLQNLLNGTASKEEIQLLKQMLASGEISIGGNVNQSVIIIGSGNTVELPPAALDRLGARPLLGNLERDLTGEEIAAGLVRIEAELPLCAPVLLNQFQEQARRLRLTLKTDPNALSESLRRERVEALAHVNGLCVEALEISFNAVATGEALPEYEARCPFRGLESFRVEDCEFFFGREELTKKLIGKIKAYSFLAILGASGSGKSSLVMAGMIPALGSDYVIFRPGTNPLDELESARGKSLIVVDQFEELFTLTRDESTRKDFITRLLDESTRARIILTLRSDFLGEVGAYRTLSGEIQSHLEIIPPMDLDELCLAMEGQAGVVGLRFEADLSQRILDDVEGEPGAMPLLQHALWELWNRRHGRSLRASEYRAFGGVKQAITSTAEKVYADCSKPEQDQLRDVFLRLTRLDDSDEGRDTRRRVPLGDLIPSGRDATSITLLLDKLANARLIVKTVNEDKIEVEVAHEALIRHWERLRIWLNEDRDNLRLRESVSESAREWEKSGKHETLLNFRWVRLDEALLLAQESRYRLTEIEQAYLKACVALRNKEQRERERRLRYTMFASISAAVIFLVLGSFGLVKSNEATTQAKIALARQLAAQAQSIAVTRNSKQMISVLLAVQSMRMFPSVDAAQILENNTLGDLVLQIDHRSPVYSAAFSLDGRYLISAENNTACVWEPATGKEIVCVTQDQLWSIAFSSNSKYLALGSWYGTIQVWDVTTRKEIAHFSHDGTVFSLAFSPDGKYLVSGGQDGTARIWELTRGKEIARMTYESWVLFVAFSPDGKYVVSGSTIWEPGTGKEIADTKYGIESAAFSLDGKRLVSAVGETVLVLEVKTGKEIARMIHDDFVYSVAFSPDGKYVVSGSDDGTARVWEVKTGKETARMTHDDRVRSVAFSPDGKYVVSGGYDATARMWDAFTGEETSRMTQDDEVRSVAFSPDGKYVVSGSVDGFVRVWLAAEGNQTTYVIEDNEPNSVAFSPDGKYLVYEGRKTIYVREAFTGTEVAHTTYGDSVSSFAFSPNGNYVVSGGCNKVDDSFRCIQGSANVWELRTGNEIAHLTTDGAVRSVTFSPDGNYIVSGGCDGFDASSYEYCKIGIARVWEVATGKEIARMTHDSWVQSVAFSPHGSYVASASANDIRVWEPFTGKEFAHIIPGRDLVHIVFSPNAQYIVSGGGQVTQVWEIATGKEIAHMTQGGLFGSFAFSPSGEYIVSGNWDGTACVWEAATGKEIACMTHEEGVGSVAFSPDEKYVVSSSWDETARVWEAATGKEIARMTHEGGVGSVGFSPDGKYVLSDGADNITRVWIYRPEDLIEIACSRVTRNLTRSEWSQYIGDVLPYQAVCPNLPWPIESKSTPTPWVR